MGKIKCDFTVISRKFLAILTSYPISENQRIIRTRKRNRIYNLNCLKSLTAKFKTAFMLKISIKLFIKNYLSLIFSRQLPIHQSC